MPTKKDDPLPEALRYLQPFANALAKLRPEELNEDVDATRLEAALRKRIRGLDEGAAETRLTQDRDLLEGWLKDKPEHPAHWIQGFLLSPNLASHLVQPPEPPLLGPEMLFEAPRGWKVKRVPFRLDLKAGKVVGSIMAIEESTFVRFLSHQEERAKIEPSGVKSSREVSDVSFGECSGKKYLLRTIEPVPSKAVHYVLRVPGGFVLIGLGTLTGAEFDELPLESKLHTLRLSASM